MVHCVGANYVRWSGNGKPHPPGTSESFTNKSRLTWHLPCQHPEGYTGYAFYTLNEMNFVDLRISGRISLRRQNGETLSASWWDIQTH